MPGTPFRDRFDPRKFNATFPLIFFVFLLILKTYFMLSFESWPDRITNGDALDYIPRAEFLYTHGSLPTREQYHSLRGVQGVDFRPPGYSIFLSSFIGFADTMEELVQLNIDVNIMLDALMACFIYLVVFLFNTSWLYRIIAASFVVLQPWTTAYIHWFAPDGLVAFFVLLSLLFFSLFIVSPPGKRRWLPFISGAFLISLTFYLRPEMILFPPMFVLISLAAARTDLKTLFLYGLISLIPFLLFVGLNVSYRLHYDGKWGVYGAVHSSTPGLRKWLKTFPASETVSLTLAWDLPAKKSADAIPDNAFDSMEEKNEVMSELLEYFNGESKTFPDDMFLNVANRRIERNPLGYYIFVPAFDLVAMWWDSNQLAWPVPLSDSRALRHMLRLFIFPFFALSLFILTWKLKTFGKQSGSWPFMISLLSIGLVVVRSILMTLMSPCPESRYIMAAWPMFFICAFYALSIVWDNARFSFFDYFDMLRGKHGGMR